MKRQPQLPLRSQRMPQWKRPPKHREIRVTPQTMYNALRHMYPEELPPDGETNTLLVGGFLNGLLGLLVIDEWPGVMPSPEFPEALAPLTLDYTGKPGESRRGALVLDGRGKDVRRMGAAQQGKYVADVQKTQ